MNEAKHTKGPWPAKLTSDGCVNVTIGEQQISFVNHTDGTLVSAAPDLLAVCEDILTFLQRSGYDTTLVREAIAKAEGR